MLSPSAVIETLSQETNIPQDLIKTILLMVLNIPLALGFRLLARPLARHTYSLVVGLSCLYYLLQHWLLYVLAAALVPYLVLSLARKYEYITCVFLSVCFLLFIHVYRFMYDYMSWKIDCSVTVMYLVTKVIYYGHYAAAHCKDINLFTYLSYCFFFPSVLVGPTFSFKTFQNFINKTNEYEQPQIKANLIVKEVVKTIVFAGATIVLMPIFTPYWALTEPRYLELAPVLKFLALNLFGICYRIKFYTAWGLTQLAIDLSGLSWCQNEGNYSSVRCGSPRFETELNPRNKTAHWNASAQIWLKEMFYDKAVGRFKSAGLATFITFFASAIWHGIYWTYYVGFIQWAVIITISKWAYKMSQALPKLTNNFVIKAVAWIVASSLLNYTGMFIVVLTWPEAVQCYKNMDFIGNWLMLALLAASFVVTPRMFRSKREHAKQQPAQPNNPDQRKDKPA